MTTKRPLPKWYDDAKFGIFIHWGLYSVPAWAKAKRQLGEVPLDSSWYEHNPYAEWYQNGMMLRAGDTWEYHIQKYGEDFRYEDFTNLWKAENYDPQQWVELFEQAGAKYIVFTTKHHEGYCLWDTQTTDYNSVKSGPHQDLVARLAEAVRRSDIRLGFYFSGLIDWHQCPQPMNSQDEVDHPANETDPVYAAMAFNQAKELIDKFHPDLFWNDIGWPIAGAKEVPLLLEYYYNTVEEAVVNDRWSGLAKDYSTKEYFMGETSLTEKWEMTRGLGTSFGYNQCEDERDYLSAARLIDLLIDTVAHNGNLLINIGPKADGTLDKTQAEILRTTGAWLKENGEAIYATRITDIPKEEGVNCTVYTTQTKDAIYLILTNFTAHEVQLPIRWHRQPLTLVTQSVKATQHETGWTFSSVDKPIVLKASKKTEQ